MLSINFVFFSDFTLLHFRRFYAINLILSFSEMVLWFTLLHVQYTYLKSSVTTIDRVHNEMYTIIIRLKITILNEMSTKLTITIDSKNLESLAFLKTVFYKKRYVNTLMKRLLVIIVFKLLLPNCY